MKLKYIIILICILIGLIVTSYNMCLSLSNKYELSLLNNKAYESLIDFYLNENKAFRFDIEQLQYINDLSIKQMDSLRREIGIRDNKIKQMGKIKEYVYITDTLKVHDTIFKDENFSMDTTLGNKWYQNNIHLQYPNIISSTIEVNTDLNCFLHTSRETINPPCKTWFGRLFLRKHDVYNVTIIENNPYINIKENKFVIIND